MFVLRRILRTNNNINFICTSNILNCDKLEGSDEFKKTQKPKGKTSGRKSKEVQIEVNQKTVRENKYTEPLDFFKTALKSSAKKVAKEMGSDKKMCSDLLNHIKEFDVSVLKEEEESLFVSSQRRRPRAGFKSTDVYKDYSNICLNIFDEKIMQETKNQVNLEIWDELEAEELSYLKKVAPQNYFQELIHWTNEGRLWHFPIDNDQGMEEEARTSFTEHVFLEQHLEPWCPKKGPLRNFMLLVLVGLSKNPYLGVAKKIEHIKWFKNYFENKKRLLQELGAMGSPKEIESVEDKS